MLTTRVKHTQTSSSSSAITFRLGHIGRQEIYNEEFILLVVRYSCR